MPKEGWIDWRNSDARVVLLHDLEARVLPLDWSAEEAWQIYSTDGIFIQEGVVFEQFKARLADHCKQVGRDHKQRDFEEQALIHDRAMYERATKNQWGQPVFDLSDAKPLLQGDVERKLHELMTPAQLQKTRPEYAPFQPRIFRHRVYQEVRRQKFLFYLEEKRLKKEAEDEKRREMVKAKKATKQQATPSSRTKSPKH